MNFANELKDVLTKENNSLDEILTLQKEIRKNVTERDWLNLETNIDYLSQLNEQFLELEESRIALLDNAKSELSIDSINYTLKKEPMLTQVNRKLRISKIENDSLNVYVSITRGFLQSVFEKVIPGARNTLYSSKGKIIHTAPDSLILNTLG